MYVKVKNLNWLWLSVIVIILDQVTKLWVRHHLSLGNFIHVTSFFNIVHARNYGAAFAFLDIVGGKQRWVFSLISIVVSVALIIWLLNLEANCRWRATGLALMIGWRFRKLLGPFYGWIRG